MRCPRNGHPEKLRDAKLRISISTPTLRTKLWEVSASTSIASNAHFGAPEYSNGQLRSEDLRKLLVEKLLDSNFRSSKFRLSKFRASRFSSSMLLFSNVHNPLAEPNKEELRDHLLRVENLRDEKLLEPNLGQQMAL